MGLLERVRYSYPQWDYYNEYGIRTRSGIIRTSTVFVLAVGLFVLDDDFKYRNDPYSADLKDLFFSDFS